MIPASIRNNNPGAMYPGPSSKRFGSTSYETLRSKDGVHKIATFPTGVHGAAAQFDLLHRDYCGRTVEEAIARWCGNFYATTYIRVLEEKGGVKATDALTQAMIRDPQVAIPLARAMAWQEAGRDYPMSDAEWLEAHAMAFAQKAEAPEWSPRNDVPTPKPETRRAELIRKIQNGAAVVGGSITAGGAAVSTIQTPAIPEVPKGLVETIGNLGSWGKALPLEQWKVLLIGAVVFAGVAGASMLVKRMRG